MKHWNKLALLSAVEAVYGTDETPAAADAIIATDVTLAPMEGAEEERGYLYPYLGHQGVELNGLHSKLDFSVDMSGAGAAGSVPNYAPALLGCGFAETVNAATSVEYELVSDAFSALTHYYVRDRRKYALVGSRGNLRIDLNAQRIARLRMSYIGLHGAVPADVALPTVEPVNFIKGRKAAKGFTTFSLHGYSGAAASVMIDLGNVLVPNLKLNQDACEITDRKVTGTAVFDAATFAAKDWDAIAKSGATGALSIVHGTAAGHIVEITAPAVQLGRYTEGESQGVMNNSIPLYFLPVDGNDELKITVK